MHALPRLLVLALAVSASTLAPFSMAQDAAEKPAKRPAIYDEAADGQAQIDAALARATRENKRVLVQWGANWCGWCHLLHDLFQKNEDVKRKLLYEYEVVLVDIGQWDKHLDLAKKLGADFKGHGVPYLTVLDASGKVLANQDTGSLEAGKAHDAAKVLAFLTTHQAPALEARAVLNDALARAREQDKAVFLHFGAPWCGWCHRLEGWLAKPDVAALLGKHFVDVKIDSDRMLGGEAMLHEYRGSEQGGIPWFAFVDGDGKVLATSDGPKGNVGFPYADEEIAAFGDMLKKAAPQMAEADREALLASLRAGREEKKS